VLDSGWVSQGAKVTEFEEVFAHYVGAKYAVATTSCTTALHLALVALGIKEGDEVLVPAFTYVATANAVEYCRARPVFVDIDLATFDVGVDQIRAKISRATKAIIPVHLFGLSADMDPIMDIARQHGLFVIEDAACGIGTRYRGRHVGTFGAAGCFSFHARKLITTGEGGMITTDDPDLAERLRSLRSHAAAVSDLERHSGGGFRLPAFAALGYNYRMTDIQAAVGVTQLEKLDEILKRRAILADGYRAALQRIEGLRVPHVPPECTHAYQSYVVLIEREVARSRDEIALALESCGIATRQGTHAVHALDYYRERYRLRREDYPVAWAADCRSLALPLFPALQESEQTFVVNRLRELLDR
jgi:dTDP-4-amino-4,6-dideoxygalactose transaminase